MLPALAKYFSISVGELIGMNELADNEVYDEINARWEKNNRDAKEAEDDRLHRENVALMQSALKEYPNDPLFLIQLSISLRKLQGTQAEKRARLQEAVLLEEQILRGKDSEVRSATLSNICFSYESLGEHEKAIEAAQRLPNLYKTRETVLAKLLKNGDKRNVALDALPAIAYNVALQLSVLAEAEKDDQYTKRADRIIRILAECSPPDKRAEILQWHSKQNEECTHE